VIRHALDWYKDKGIGFDVVVLLQATSPLRNAQHVKEALAIWSPETDMVVSVKEADSNPYYVLFEEDKEGFLQKSKEGNFTRRQDCPEVYEYNGAVYVVNVSAVKKKGIVNFNKKRKFIMSKESSVDVDDLIDFKLAEFLMEERIK